LFDPLEDLDRTVLLKAFLEDDAQEEVAGERVASPRQDTGHAYERAQDRADDALALRFSSKFDSEATMVVCTPQRGVT
jgi:hypothetical protein